MSSHETTGWSVWLYYNTVSCRKESVWGSRLGRHRKTLYGNPQSELLRFCRVVCKLHKRIPLTVKPGCIPTATLASAVPNNYLFWLFSFPYLHWFLYQTYPLAKEALWLNPKQNSKQRSLSPERLGGRSLGRWGGAPCSSGSISGEGQGVGIGIRRQDSSPIGLS